MTARVPVRKPTPDADRYELLRRRVAEIARELAELVGDEAPGADGEMTVQEAADAVGRSCATVINYCEHHGVGVFSRRERRWIVSRSRLRRYLVERFGEARLPAGLR